MESTPTRTICRNHSRTSYGGRSPHMNVRHNAVNQRPVSSVTRMTKPPNRSRSLIIGCFSIHPAWHGAQNRAASSTSKSSVHARHARADVAENFVGDCIDARCDLVGGDSIAEE